jgi:FkbM family methyltransferase
MSIHQAALGLATRLYRATPFQKVRAAYFHAFLRLVRGRRVIRHVEAMTFELDLGELIDVGIFLQQYERDVVALIERFARPGWIVLDIGANIGAHTLRFSKLVGPEGRVYAFEPMDYAYTKLIRNLSLNASANTQPARLALSDRNQPHQEVHYRSSWASTGERKQESSRVDFRRLDDWCDEHRVTHVDLIKMDVDGHEMQALSGGVRLLERSRPPLLMEAGAWHFTREGENPLQLLAGLGYRFWETASLIETDLDGIRARLPAEDEAMGFSINLLASPTPPPPGTVTPTTTTATPTTLP